MPLLKQRWNNANGQGSCQCDGTQVDTMVVEDAYARYVHLVDCRQLRNGPVPVQGRVLQSGPEQRVDEAASEAASATEEGQLERVRKEGVGVDQAATLVATV